MPLGSETRDMCMKTEYLSDVMCMKTEYLSDVIVFDNSEPKFVEVKMDQSLSTTVLLKEEYIDLINRLIKLEKKLYNKLPEIIPDTSNRLYSEVKKYEVDNDLNIKHYFFIEKYVSNFWKIKPRGYYGIATIFLLEENNNFFDVIIVARNQNLKKLNNKKFSNCKKYIIEFKKLNPIVASKLKAKTVKIRDIIYDNIYHLNYRPIDLYIPKFIRIAVNNINNNNNIFVKNIILETSSLNLSYNNDIYDYNKKYLKSKFGWKFFFLKEEESYFTYEKIKNIIKEPFKIKLHMNEKEILKMMMMYPKLFSK
ncbi:MAG: hypothetical protein QXR30_03820 [Candidatus Woesearchaeota archaeon]